MNYKTLGIGIAIGVTITVLALAPMIEYPSASAKHLRKIQTTMTMASIVDPIPGHEAHQITMLLPPKEGILYSGILTFSSSYPVEVIVFHGYEQPEGAPANSLQVEIDGKRYALSLMFLGGEGKGAKVGSINFAGNALALHTLDGTAFTATASIDGWARTIRAE